MEGDGSADNLVTRIRELRDSDGLDPSRTCWLVTDNASTFKGTS